MAVTTSFSWEDGTNVFLNNAFTAGSQNQPAIIANFSGDRYFGAWSDPAFANQVEGRVVAADQTNIVDEFTVNNPATNAGFSQFDPSVAGLTGGNFVVTYHDRAADPGGDIRARLYSPSGTPLGADFAIDAGVNDDTTATVSELFGGGFVVTYERDFGGGDIDIRARVFNSAGTDLSGLITVETGRGAETAPWVAGLNFGGFVVVWQDADDGGVYLRRFDNNGAPLAAEQLIDNFGANTDIHVQALNDGGFAVAYTDTGWGTGQDITFQIFNANGTARTGFIKANSAAAPGGLDAGNQNLPTITTMGDIIVVGWVDPASATSFAQAFDAAGNRLGAIDAVNSAVIEHEIAGLSGGRLAVVRRSSVEEGTGLGDSIRTTVNQFVRTQTGDGADDTITGVDDALQEALSGGGGNDTLIGGIGGDRLIGGTGSDTASYETASAGVTANLGNASLNTGDAAGDTYSSIENLTGSAFADILFGDGAGNVINGGAGDDAIRGGGGADALGGGAGNDVIFGDDGADNLGGNAGADILIGGAGADTIGGDDGDDSMAGEAGDDVMFGGAGNDLMSGGDNDDIMVGQDGADLMNGNAGNDNMNGGSGADILIGELGNDTIGGGDDNDVVVGNEGDDQLFGEDGADQMAGGDGNDTMVGGNSDDVMGGGIGDDVMIGDAGNDGVFGEDGNDNINVGDGNDVVLGGNGNDTIGGGTGDDNLRGEAGDDVLFGETGNDFLTGGTGNDVMVTGSGNDVLVFTAGDGNDTITDFVAGGTDDLIILQATSLASFGAVLAATTIVGGNAVITYNGANTITLNGVSSVAQLTAADFAFL